MADMLRADLADARREWMKAAQDDPGEYEKRSQSDFLSDENHEGERLDFHSLRHTCGGWLAMSGAHPKAVQAIMRHSTITLTMDTYGHFFPGQEADTVARLAEYMGDKPDHLRATGTTDQGATPGYGADPQQYPRQLGRDSQRDGARGCDPRNDTRRANGGRKSLRAANQCDDVRSNATENDNAPGRTRTCGLRFRKPLLYPPELRAQISRP